MKTAVGIDPSLTGSAVVVMRADLTFDAERFGSDPAKGLARIERFKGLAAKVLFAIPADVSIVLLEGYSYGSAGRALTDLGEYGGLLRMRLLKLGCPVFEVPPTTLKLFVTGKGNASKQAMAVGVYKHWGYEPADGDRVDAYGLARMAATVAGFCKAANDGQRRALAKIIENPKGLK